MRGGLFLLHEIFPDFGPMLAPFFFIPFAGLVLLVVGWIRRWRARRDPVEYRPAAAPTVRILAVSVGLTVLFALTLHSIQDVDYGPLTGGFIGSVFLFMLPWLGLLRNDTAAEAVAVTWVFAGWLTCGWWAFHILRGGSSRPLGRPPMPPLELDGQIRSEADACDQCRSAAVGSIGEPLRRIAQNTTPLSSLYRCAVCHSYWRRDPKSMRVISVVIATQEFPQAVI